MFREELLKVNIYSVTKSNPHKFCEWLPVKVTDETVMYNSLALSSHNPFGAFVLVSFYLRGFEWDS